MVSEMECKDAKQKLSEDLDGRLSAEESKSLDAHVEACESCRSEKVDLSKINEALADLAVPMVEIPDPEKAWKAINEKLGEAEPGDEDPYSEQILVDTSGEVDIRGLVGGSLEDDELDDESDSSALDIFGIAASTEVNDDVPMATLAPPPVLMPMSRKPSWMVPAAVIGGVFIAGVITLAAFLFVKEGRRQKVEEREELARSLDSRFDKTEDEATISAHDEKRASTTATEPQRDLLGEGVYEQEEPRPSSKADESVDLATQPLSDDSLEEADPASPKRPEPGQRASGASRRPQLASTKPHTRSRARTPATRSAKATGTPDQAAEKKEETRAAAKKSDDPLSALLGAGESPRPSEKGARPVSSLPDRLSQNQIKRVMTTAESQIKRCYQKYKEAGLLRVSVTVKGDTGKITSVSVHGDFKGTPTASCALRAVRPLSFPRFQGPTQSFTYPYLLR